MRNKSGLPPYDAGVFFIIAGSGGKHWPLRDVGNVAGYRTTKMLAHMFGKSNREVARDIIDRSLKLEEGEHGEWQRDDPEGQPSNRAAASRR
jgi:hypothetical protein